MAVGGHVLVWDMTVTVTFTMGECGKPRIVDDGSRKASRNGSQDIANTNQSTRRFVVIDECTWPPNVPLHTRPVRVCTCLMRSVIEQLIRCRGTENFHDLLPSFLIILF